MASSSVRSWAWGLAVMLLVSGTFAQEDADDDYVDAEVAHLLVHKSVPLLDDSLAYPLSVQGRNITVNMLIYNAGASTASDVVLTDTLPEGAKLLDGSLTANYPKIAVGSQVSHTYTMTFTSGGSMDVTFLPLATVTYTADSEGTKQVGSSSKAGIFVLTPVQQIQRYALMAGRYASLGIARTPADWRNIAILLGIAASVLGANWSFKTVTSSRAGSRRRKALQELEKSE